LLVDRCRFWSQYLVVLVGQDGKKVCMIWNTSPVAVLTFITRHFSRAVYEHERAHEDVPMVAEPTVLVSLGTEADGRLVEFHPARANLWQGISWEGSHHSQHCDH